MQRVRTPEIMDEPGVERGELERALGFIRLVNRRLGGVSALVKHLRRWSRHWPKDRPVTLLDIATGSADLPIAAVRWARGAGFDLRVTGVDLHETTLELAREHVSQHEDVADAITLERVDAFRIIDRFGVGAFDYAHAGLFLHHLSFEQALTVLKIMDRVTTRGLVWNDLHRSRVAYAAIHVMTLGMPRIVKHDARVSVRAGYTREEVLDMARRVELKYCEWAMSEVCQRFTLAGEKPKAWVR